MFDLPKSCVVNKFIPKNIFYKKVTMATSVKKEFINLIEKITWLYKIAPDTLGVNKTDNIEELENLNSNPDISYYKLSEIRLSYCGDGEEYEE